MVGESCCKRSHPAQAWVVPANDADSLFPSLFPPQETPDEETPDEETPDEETPDEMERKPAATRFELRRGDCLEGMRELAGESVDLPDRRPEEEDPAWCVEWAREIRRLLRPGGSFFLNVGAVPSNPLMPHRLLLAFTPEIFCLQNTFHWIKSITVEPRAGEPVSAGHFKPINSKRYVNDCHEFVYHFTKSGDVPLDRRGVGVAYADKSNIGRWGHTGGRDKRCRGNNWFIPYETIQRRSQERPHPATFPVKLAEMCVGIVEPDPSELVMLDPFLGIGHAGVAAKQCGVGRFVGFEIDEEYFREAEERLILRT